MEAEDILINIKEMKGNENISVHFKPIIEYTEEMAELMIKFKSVEDEDNRNRIKDLIVECRDNIERAIPVVAQKLNVSEEALQSLKDNLISEEGVHSGGYSTSESYRPVDQVPKKRSKRTNNPNQLV